MVILPTASAPDGKGVPERWGRRGVDHFRALGAEPAAVLALTRADCERPDFAAAVHSANLIYFSGGKPDYLYQTLRGTALWQAVLDVLASGGVLAGCSAGAMIVGSFMPDVGTFPQMVRWGPGFGLIPEAVVIPVTETHNEYARKVAAELSAFRIKVDERNEKLGYKIREAQSQKVPYMLVVGDKEAAEGTVAVRHRFKADLGAMKVADFASKLSALIATHNVNEEPS